MLRFVAGAAVLVLVSACSIEGRLPGAPDFAIAAPAAPAPAPAAAGSADLNDHIGRAAATYGVPESLLRRIILRESGYNPRAHNGAHWGLMQIRYDTARSMGYRGTPEGLLDAETNLRYGGKYLAGAYKVAKGDQDKAVSFYASGYYYHARRMGLLEEVGLKRRK